MMIPTPGWSCGPGPVVVWLLSGVTRLQSMIVTTHVVAVQIWYWGVPGAWYQSGKF